MDPSCGKYWTAEVILIPAEGLPAKWLRSRQDIGLLPEASFLEGCGQGVTGSSEAKAPGMDRARRLATIVALLRKINWRQEPGHGGRLGKRQACRPE